MHVYVAVFHLKKAFNLSLFPPPCKNNNDTKKEKNPCHNNTAVESSYAPGSGSKRGVISFSAPSDVSMSATRSQPDYPAAPHAGADGNNWGGDTLLQRTRT